MGRRPTVYIGLLNRSAATLAFPGAAPLGLELDVPYKVDAIPIDTLDSYMHSKWTIPDGITYANFAQRLGVTVATLKRVQKGTSRLTFEPAAALFRGWGGLSLMLAFTRSVDINKSRAPTRLVDAQSEALIKPLFVQEYKAQGLSRAEVARRLHQSPDAVVAFEGTLNSRTETIAHYFGAALGMQVEFLGMHSPVPTQ